MVTSGNLNRNDGIEDLPNFSDPEDFLDDIKDDGKRMKKKYSYSFSVLVLLNVFN